MIVTAFGSAPAVARATRRSFGGSRGSLGRRGPAVLAALAAVCSISCAARTETRSDVDQHSYSTSVSILGSRADALLEQGRQAVAEGRFADGSAAFQSVYDMQDAKPEHREDALLALAQVYANVLNRDRDPQKALALYRKLLDEFPDTKRRYEIEQAIAALEESSP